MSWILAKNSKRMLKHCSPSSVDLRRRSRRSGGGGLTTTAEVIHFWKYPVFMECWNNSLFSLFKDELESHQVDEISSSSKESSRHEDAASLVRGKQAISLYFTILIVVIIFYCRDLLATTRPPPPPPRTVRHLPRLHLPLLLEATFRRRTRETTTRLNSLQSG